MKTINNFVRFVKNDFETVQYYWSTLLNGKIPHWLVTIYYIVLFPIGITLSLIIFEITIIGTLVYKQIIIHKDRA